ncbi:hypothetical protein [Mycolicibacterium sp. XJ870]
MSDRSRPSAADLDRLLDELRTGTILLTVPILDGAIQVGIGGAYPTGTIALSKTATEVRVRHRDGRRLQVQIVHDWQDADTPAFRTTVFDEPVDQLTLTRSEGRWMAVQNNSVDRAEDLAQFVNTVARFGLAKHRKSDQRASAA